jgi:hypothetical protein
LYLVDLLVLLLFGLSGPILEFITIGFYALNRITAYVLKLFDVDVLALLFKFVDQGLTLHFIDLLVAAERVV